MPELTKAEAPIDEIDLATPLTLTPSPLGEEGRVVVDINTFTTTLVEPVAVYVDIMFGRSVEVVILVTATPLRATANVKPVPVLSLILNKSEIGWLYVRVTGLVPSLISKVDESSKTTIFPFVESVGSKT